MVVGCSSVHFISCRCHTSSFYEVLYKQKNAFFIATIRIVTSISNHEFPFLFYRKTPVSTNLKRCLLTVCWLPQLSSTKLPWPNANFWVFTCSTAAEHATLCTTSAWPKLEVSTEAQKTAIAIATSVCVNAWTRTLRQKSLPSLKVPDRCDQWQNGMNSMRFYWVKSLVQWTLYAANIGHANGGRIVVHRSFVHCSFCIVNCRMFSIVVSPKAFHGLHYCYKDTHVKWCEINMLKYNQD